jgi:hypothetical protein
MQVIEQSFLVFNVHGYFQIMNKNRIVFNLLDVAEMIYRRIVGTKEKVGRKFFHDILESHTGQDFLFVGYLFKQLPSGWISKISSMPILIIPNHFAF